ncbi:MAG TPA: hypothetical protein VGI64_01500 [Streptosporangiaceae bacterium]|jgi:hypothetical protein
MIAVIAVTTVAALGLGVVVGWLLNRTWAATAMSWSQERMQRQVRFWQAEAEAARRLAAWQPDHGGRPGHRAD